MKINRQVSSETENMEERVADFQPLIQAHVWVTSALSYKHQFGTVNEVTIQITSKASYN